MELMIKPGHAARMAFGQDAEAGQFGIDENLVRTVQLKYLKPVLEGIYDKIREDIYRDFRNQYVIPLLVLYIKIAVLPSLKYNYGSLGIVKTGTGQYSSATDLELGRLTGVLRSQAETLKKEMVRRMEDRPEEFPDYEPAKEGGRMKIESGIVL